MILSEEELSACLGFGEHTNESIKFTLTAVAQAVESKILEKLKQQEPVAYMTYKGYLLHAEDPKVNEHSDPEPLYANPIKSLELVGEVVLGPKDVGTMRTVFWKSGILPEVGSKIYVSKPSC